MNWVKRHEETQNKCLNKSSSDEEVKWVLPTRCSEMSPERRMEISQHLADTVLHLKDEKHRETFTLN